jgi:hypothetical protein
MKQTVGNFDYKKYKTVSKKTMAYCKKILNKKSELLRSIPWAK